jgi:bacteriorhodopsin
MANGVQGQIQKPIGMNGAGSRMVGAKMGMAEEPKSKKWLWWTIGIVVVLIIAGLVWWGMS